MILKARPLWLGQGALPTPGPIPPDGTWNKNGSWMTTLQGKPAVLSQSINVTQGSSCSGVLPYDQWQSKGVWNPCLPNQAPGQVDIVPDVPESQNPNAGTPPAAGTAPAVTPPPAPGSIPIPPVPPPAFIPAPGQPDNTTPPNGVRPTPSPVGNPIAVTPLPPGFNPMPVPPPGIALPPPPAGAPAAAPPPAPASSSGAGTTALVAGGIGAAGILTAILVGVFRK